ncbi:hypothetical protein POM88_032022 [Heracleum sosnowskyi]|uniref:Uncharacterized protein n=1 Tax=Heracleum sosnowskyi TaxID=360622 RepID=A0AAD8MKC9_9APIA|nr:hypothetical protein POM88_032022 [Heracleum sosnowskyi]
MIEELSISCEQLGISGGFCDYQGSRHERSINFPSLAPREHSEDLSIHCESDKLQTKPNDAELGEETRGSLPTRAMDRGIIGQIPFWKARSTIVNQQRLFAAQVFELHRLIKVQKLMAESPGILFEEGAYLGNPLKASALKKVRL